MRWILFIVGLLIVHLLQTGVLPVFHAPGWLDLMLALALLCGLVAPASDARLAAWIVGFAIDLDTAGPLGLHALALGLAVLAQTYLRELVNLGAWWVRWLVSFVVALPAQLLVRLHAHFYFGDDWSLWQLGLMSVTTAAVSALLAALALALPTLSGRRRRRVTLARW